MAKDLPYLAPQPWRSLAACLGDNSPIWLPDGLKEIHPEAKKTCSSCPVREECLEWTLADEQGKPAHARAGIWGGKSRAERAKIWRQRKKAAKPLLPHEPEIRTCACGCGCGKTFDAWRTIEGNPKKEPRKFATRNCQLIATRRLITTRPRLVKCKLEECETIFNPFVTFNGTPQVTPRVYCCKDHQRIGVRRTRERRKVASS
jgi:WhiB family transcriptional regulator, redox-sensing transcriptional regulator